MNKKLLALYGLKWNPFAPGVPVEALHVTTRLESFCWRVRQLIGEGGFALVTGAPGTGKSAALRILAAALAAQRDVKLGVVQRDVVIGGVVAFKQGERVQVEAESPDPQRPEYRYVVLSRTLNKKFRLSDLDLFV